MLKNKKSISWKTTVCGVISAVGGVFTQSGNPTLEFIGQILTPIGTFCTGYYAKDAGADND